MFLSRIAVVVLENTYYQIAVAKGKFFVIACDFGFDFGQGMKVNTVNIVNIVNRANSGLAGLGDASRRDAHKKWKIKSEEHASTKGVGRWVVRNTTKNAKKNKKKKTKKGKKWVKKNPRIWEKGRLGSQSMRCWPRKRRWRRESGGGCFDCGRGCLVPVSAMQPHTHTHTIKHLRRHIDTPIQIHTYRCRATDTDTMRRPHFADAK